MDGMDLGNSCDESSSRALKQGGIVIHGCEMLDGDGESSQVGHAVLAASWAEVS